jgi:hypothetical protein
MATALAETERAGQVSVATDLAVGMAPVLTDLVETDPVATDLMAAATALAGVVRVATPQAVGMDWVPTARAETVQVATEVALELVVPDQVVTE